MPRRQPIPRLWLMTDERMGDALLPAIRRLPRGAGVVFRHYSLPRTERRALFRAVRAVARMRRLILVTGGAAPGRADGRHGSRDRHGLATWPVHDRAELVAALRGGADAVFVSPLHATRSHPGVQALGRVRFAMIARASPVPVIALGGMDASRALPPHAHGWAGIDAFVADI